MTTQYILKNSGGTFYHKDKEMTIPHREDGPAVEGPDICNCWYLNGKLHREDGPAIEWKNGDRHWLINGKLHREDGPAIEHASGYKQWYLNDKKVTKAEHKKLTQMYTAC